MKFAFACLGPLSKFHLRTLRACGFIHGVERGGEVLFPPGTRSVVAQCRLDLAVNRKRMQVFYSGRVQGVGFRYTVKTVASGFEVVGTVRNLFDGRVELVAEGQRPELEAFRAAIRDAGLDHFIQDEQLHWSEAENKYRGFEIIV